MLYLYFDRIWAFTRENDEKIERVLALSPESGYMLSSFRTFLGSQMRKIFEDCPDTAEKGLPAVLLADHYSNTLFLVWQWATLEEPNCSKEQAALYLRKLLSIP